MDGRCYCHRVLLLGVNAEVAVNEDERRGLWPLVILIDR